MQQQQQVGVTPRTGIQGAHQQGVTVKAGTRLTKRAFVLRPPVALSLGLLCVALASDWIHAKSSLGALKARTVSTFTTLAYLPTGFQFAVLLSVASSIYFVATLGRPYLVFAYNCFLKPFLSGNHKAAGIGSNEHQERLEMFYEGQADVYDVTRKRYFYTLLLKYYVSSSQHSCLD